MKLRVIVVPAAETDMADIHAGIAESAPINAAHWFHELRRAIASLEFMPQRCPVAPESPARGYEIRQLIFGNYRVLFTITDESVFVLHVRHGARRAMNSDEVNVPFGE